MEVDIFGESSGPLETHYYGDFIGTWIKRTKHSVLHPNCTVVLEQIGSKVYPMPKALLGVYNEGALRFNFAEVDPSVLTACPWFAITVVLRRVPYLDHDVDWMHRQKETLEARVTELEKEEITLTEKLPKLKDENAAMQKRLDTQRGVAAKEIDDAQKKFRAASGSLDDARARNKDLLREIANLSKHLKHLGGRID